VALTVRNRGTHAPRRPEQSEHPDGVELSWRGRPTPDYEVLIHDRGRRKSHRHRGVATPFVLPLPEGDYSWRVQLPGRRDTATDPKRFRLHAGGEVESLKAPAPPESLRFRLHRRLSGAIATLRHRLRILVRVGREPRGSLRSVRLIEICVCSWGVW
jgi:hypothetical protein